MDKIILVGKEPEKGRLLISTSVNGKTVNATLGDPGSVPSCVSRCRPAEGIAHCKIVLSDNGDMVLTNLKPENVTYVNGREIISKKITSDADVSLGKLKYPINIKEILSIVNRPAGQPAGVKPSQKVNEYSIRPLKAVWDTYHDEMFNLQKRQKNQALVKGLYMPLTILSSIAGIAARHIGLDDSIASAISYLMYATAAFVLFYGLYKSFTDKSLEEKEQISEKFQNDYVCPNPECRHFMGNQPYKILRQNSSCPYCKCKFNEK